MTTYLIYTRKRTNHEIVLTDIIEDSYKDWDGESIVTRSLEDIVEDALYYANDDE